MKTIQELISLIGGSSAFSRRFEIGLRTVQYWKSGRQKPPRVVALEAQNAEMLAMLREVQAEMQHVASACKHEFSLPFCLASFEATCQKLDDLIKKVEGENGK